jgi:dCMP deaminase
MRALVEKLSINPNRIDLDEAYLQMAEIWAKRSKANRKQVGALLVKDKQIISDGYNGMPAGDKDEVCEYIDESGNLVTRPELMHAESNALMKLAENGGLGAQDATMYLTMSPCLPCAKLMKQAKIKRVVFRERYRETDGIEFLTSRGVEVVQLESK